MTLLVSSACLLYVYEISLTRHTGRMIEFCKLFGLASELKTFPDNEIKKGIYNQQVKKLREVKKTIKWPQDSNDLPILTWEQCESLKSLCSVVQPY